MTIATFEGGGLTLRYELFCNSVRGSSHIRKGIPCEDFGIKIDCGDYKIFAVADGHGDPNCLRSNIGSKYVCQIASEELEDFALTIKEQGWEEKLFDKHEAMQLVERLILSIVGKWANEVSEELEHNPLTEDEIQKASAYAKEYINGIRTERMYGTTLIAGLQTEKYLLLLQQGDGRCDVFDSDGNVSQPIPWDDRCVGTATTSLCDTDAAQSCRYHIINLEENPVIACIAGTDGIEDSFPTSMEKTHAYYRELLYYACENGVQALEEYLMNELNELSANGSADDITVSGIIDVERVRPFLDDFKEKNRLVNLEDEVMFLNGKVKSIEEGGKFRHLEKKYNDAVIACEKSEKRYHDLTVACDTLAKTIAAHEQGVPELQPEFNSFKDVLTDLFRTYILPQDSLSHIKKDYERLCDDRDAAQEEMCVANEKKAIVEKEYLPYKERYDSFVKMKEDAVKRLNAIKN